MFLFEKALGAEALDVSYEIMERLFELSVKLHRVLWPAFPHTLFVVESVGIILY